MASISPYLHISPDPGIWLIQLFAIVLATVCVNFVLMRVLDAVERATDRTASVWDDALIHAARVPLRLLVWVVGLSAAVRLIQAVEPSLVFDYAPEVRRVAIIGIVAMFALRLIRDIGSLATGKEWEPDAQKGPTGDAVLDEMQAKASLEEDQGKQTETPAEEKEEKAEKVEKETDDDDKEEDK